MYDLIEYVYLIFVFKIISSIFFEEIIIVYLQVYYKLK